MTSNDRPIQVGDLVCVVKVHCDKQWLNHVFQVTGITRAIRKCYVCGHQEEMDTATGLSHFYMPLAWLRRIPPLSELEGERTEEKLKEPA